MNRCDERNRQTIAGIVLAAGGSSRFGMPKQLVLWQNETLVHRVSRIAIQANVKPVIAVLGAAREAVEGTLKDLKVDIVINHYWVEGQSTSIKVGIDALNKDICEGCIFLLADQPMVTVNVIRALIEEYKRTHAPIIAPLVMGQRSNPIFFSQSTFNDLMAIQGDQGGRAIFSRFPVHYFEWLDQNLLIDIDLPNDLDRLEW